MNQQGVRWTSEQVLALAPDDASRKAGNRLGTAGPWSGAGSSGSGAVWGLCKGSGSKPYRTVVDTTGPAYKCSCPSRKFPCKHALGLLLLWAADEEAVADSTTPDWAGEWLEGRKKRAEQSDAGAEQPAKAGDPEAARRRAERRAARITAGATELEQRLADLLRGGLASAEQSGYGLWEETAARMVDAQAPGLAGRVRELGAIPGSGPGWPVRLLEECALIHLLDAAWLGIERLPEPLAATVRTRVGLTSPAEGPPVRDHWLILAQYDSSDSKITTRRIWLYGQESGRTALLLSFGAAGRSPQQALPVGLVIDAELTPYAGAGQLRADLGEQFGAPVPIGSPPPGGPAAAAVEAYGQALRDDPWLDSWPVTLSGVIPSPGASPGRHPQAGEGWQLADAEGESALPIAPAALSRPGLWKLAALSGGDPVTVFGECGHQGFTPLAAWSKRSAETVPLI
ncbi:SWIM zinc finger family protein [Streptomyces lunaelactis]|uniref:SWIM zinc finger family protein n=1 Tax=Streptomyces lunaelactis TaxID=1535768 RepID=UPI001584D761|nr:SWIM zinc finger family protein [Streptomyces lunaelactis]NUK11934.1 SWIM zinc finger family protein [Streptomyces lunaelactis]NUK72514.1 SWIM zinc finger family protein [Streptomyces lunaelactis]NUK76683.1 SWIM zinc finger family protein [Streptomyces lunaelactis]NUL13577.1 SWIM zinc finger family protein [Streptomyces lunaelactis]NUL26700.1 SWIM zinc finger family protein [Streptomyces lunaelactis]